MTCEPWPANSEGIPEEPLPLPSSDTSIIRLPIRFHMIRTALNKGPVTMDMWFSPQDIHQTLLPEINRIWEPAGIEWYAEQVVDQEPEERADLHDTLQEISRANRTTKNRTHLIKSLVTPKYRHPVFHNVYFVPFVGSTTQGFATFGGPVSILNPDGGNQCFVGVWTDKPSGGKKPPQKFPLIEKGSFRIGSIARTVSHELGHNLLLSHPERSTQTQFHRLMGGKKHGYRLIDSEIVRARKTATGRINTINHWIAAQQTERQP